MPQMIVKGYKANLAGLASNRLATQGNRGRPLR
jgi:hypothetical protein